MSPHEEEVNPVLLGARLHSLADGIADYLDATVVRHGEFPARSFYGESFAALLLGPMGSKYATSVERLRVLYQNKDKQAADFHWEFNNYAWYSLFRKTGDPVARSFVLPLRFRHTPVTNWTLLRSVTRFLVGQETEVAGREAVNVLERFQSRCLSFLDAYRRMDGSFPMVLNGCEQGFPAAGSVSDARFPGWYAYNNYFDYLPFPYVVRKGVRLTPSFGGEQYGSPLYTPAGVPLPGRYGKRGCDLMRGSRLWSFFWGKRLVVVSRAGLLIRRFRFLENEIVVEDFQWGFRKLSARYAFDQVKRVDDRTIMIRGGATVTFSEPMHVEDTKPYYWGGPLCLMRTASPSWRCVVRVCGAEGEP